mmetsp:Transcript_1490/g.2875  ORF Transcript_1490/g.2875 Transcript_1490/m.2875 type:complete len:225 (+) Transcript_1490:180-854(+)
MSWLSSLPLPSESNSSNLAMRAFTERSSQQFIATSMPTTNSARSTPSRSLSKVPSISGSSGCRSKDRKCRSAFASALAAVMPSNTPLSAPTDVSAYAAAKSRAFSLSSAQSPYPTVAVVWNAQYSESTKSMPVSVDMAKAPKSMSTNSRQPKNKRFSCSALATSESSFGRIKSLCSICFSMRAVIDLRMPWMAVEMAPYTTTIPTVTNTMVNTLSRAVEGLKSP